MSTPLGKCRVYDLKLNCFVPIDPGKHEDTFEILQEYFLKGRRDRYIMLPEVPCMDKGSGEPLFAGDILSNGKNKWVIKFDLMSGVYCTMIDLPDAYNRLQNLLDNGFERIGNISNAELLDGKAVAVFL